MEWIWLSGGILIGGLLAWAILRSQAASKVQRLQATLGVAEERSSTLSREWQSNQQKLENANERIIQLSNRNARLEVEIESRDSKLLEQKKEVEQLNEKFSLEFKNLANQIFEEKTQKFTDQNKLNLGELLTPLKERLGEFQKKVEDSNLQDEKRSTALTEQIKNLRELNQQITQEAKSLTRALRGDSKTQGSWGEMQLEAILNKAGLEKDIHYFREKNLKTEEGGNQRLDFIINLPDGKNLILDSKVSLTDYSRYFDSDDEAEKQASLKRHLNSLQVHIRSLGDKNYQNLYDINPPDYVLMFVANEPALTIALKEDPQLYENALDRNIVLVSTTTLLATLRTISYIWRQELQNQNAEEIARQAGALYDKFVGFSDELLKLGSQLDTVQRTYNECMKKLSEGKDTLVRKSERLKELGAKSTKQINQRLIDNTDD